MEFNERDQERDSGKSEDQLPGARVGHVSESRSKQVRRWRKRFSAFAIVAILFCGLLPWMLGGIGKRLGERANQSLRNQSDSLGSAVWADRLFVVQGFAPFWGATARRNRGDLIESVINGVEVASLSQPSRTGLIEQTVAFVSSRLPKITSKQEEEYGPRYDVEEFLHKRGRDREVIELESLLPLDGKVAERVRAHLYLGDVQGAAAISRERVGDVHQYFVDELLTKGAVLCMANDFAGAAPAFEERRSWYKKNPSWQQSRFFETYSECLLRADDFKTLEEILPEIAAHDDEGRTIAAYYRANLALHRGDTDNVVHLLETGSSSNAWYSRSDIHIALLKSVALARAGRLDALLTAARATSIETESSNTRRIPDHLFNTLFFPVIDESHVREAAATLANASDHPKANEMRQAAAKLYMLLAIRLGRRWDPEADIILNRIEELDPDLEGARDLRNVLAFAHGDWVRFDEAKSENFEELKQVRQQFLDYSGNSEEDSQDPTFVGFSLRSLHPGATYVYRHIARLMASPLTNAQKFDILRIQKQSAPLAATFFRITNVIVFGEMLGIDVSPWKNQLSALRQMVKSQPNGLLYNATGLGGSF